MNDRVILTCGCGQVPGGGPAPDKPVPDPPPTTGIEGETGAAQ